MTRDSGHETSGLPAGPQRESSKNIHFFHFFRESPRHSGGGLFYFYTLKDETIARNAENEVVKKASTLTANGVPASAGRSLFRGLAFLSTVPKE